MTLGRKTAALSIMTGRERPGEDKKHRLPDVACVAARYEAGKHCPLTA